MSYDLAVWEGKQPADDAAACAMFNELYAQYIDADVEHPPTPDIVTYVDLLLRKWPDLPDDTDDISPWAAGPLIGEAAGPIIYFTLRWSMAEVASAFAVEKASVLGLVCFDPQQNRLRT